MKSAVGWRNSTASFNKQTSKIPMNPTVIISRQFQNHTRLRRQNLIGWFIGKGSLTVMSCKHRTTRIVTEATISAGNLFVGGVCFIFYPGSSCLYYLYNLIVQQKLRSKRRKTHTYLILNITVPLPYTKIPWFGLVNICSIVSLLFWMKVSGVQNCGWNWSGIWIILLSLIPLFAIPGSCHTCLR